VDPIYFHKQDRSSDGKAAEFEINETTQKEDSYMALLTLTPLVYAQCWLEGIIDEKGRHWFTQASCAEELGTHRSTLSRIRDRHSSKFIEDVDYKTIVANRRAQIFYSEAGFNKICCLSGTDTAVLIMQRLIGEGHHIEQSELPSEDTEAQYLSNDAVQVVGKEMFGDFDGCVIEGIVDQYGKYWFTERMTANALGINQSTVSRIRRKNRSAFEEGSGYTYATLNNCKQIVYSEEGFLKICGYANTPVAHELRNWMMEQFRVKQQGKEIVVQPKTVEHDAFSRLGDSLVTAQQATLRCVAENRHTILGLQKTTEEVKEETKTLTREQQALAESQSIQATQLERVADKVDYVAASLTQQPGEVTAYDFAKTRGWLSKAGLPHNCAVILAAINAGYDKEGWITKKRVDICGKSREEYVFTVTGMVNFVLHIDSKYASGEHFTIKPNEYAAPRVKERKYHVYKS
jgi:prophage antirepressor-like protein